MSKGKSCKSSKKGKGKASNKNQSPTIAPRSDRRLKTDISVIGNSPSGIKIYQFRYKRDIVLAGGRVLDSDSTFVVHRTCSTSRLTPWSLILSYSKIDVDFYKI